MKSFAVLAGAGAMILGSLGVAAAQSSAISGTPASPYPYAAPHEIRDGCRTVHVEGTTTRVPVDCAEPLSTGSVVTAPAQPMAPAMGVTGPASSGTPGSAFPYAAPHEIRDGCRTVHVEGTTTRVPADCVR
ncbi:MAG TPA: hypothetical protein VHL98_00550 [Microvirga sp.]|jgi:hypothetical protein|nr:hypothetical protein [Microvirga sp.]